MIRVRVLTAAAVWLTVLAAFGQSAAPTIAPTPLADLLIEAKANNSRVAAAADGWQAAKEVPRQVSSLPDPTFTFQQVGVGSPKPFAGYTDSDFAYAGIGVSQEIPYPGKLGLRAQVAERNAEVKGAEVDATVANVADAVKTDYLQLAYLQITIGILRENEQLIKQLIQDATAHYEVGQGSQADILQAQVERTKVIREITLRREQMGQLQADLKGLLHRDQDSPDIVTDGLPESPLRYTSVQLLEMVRGHNPELQVDAGSVREQDAALASARSEGKPDFGIGYMYQNTDRKYRDYYMFTLNIQLPRRGPAKAKIAEAAKKLAQSRETLDAHLQRQLAQVKQEYVTASSDAELLTEYRQGLIPQSSAAYRSALNAYSSNQEPFTQVLLALVNVLHLKLDQAQVLDEREIALAHLETLTGVSLR